ncbi:hypothetical protein CB1_000568066 [Camelus ferus]|nr:hypothetical protein CB1_000568066 [Camelus ferus]
MPQSRLSTSDTRVYGELPESQAPDYHFAPAAPLRLPVFLSEISQTSPFSGDLGLQGEIEGPEATAGVDGEELLACSLAQGTWTLGSLPPNVAALNMQLNEGLAQYSEGQGHSTRVCRILI